MTTITYNREWLAGQTGTDDRTRQCLLGAFAHLGIPRHLIDIGCKGGVVPQLALQLGVESVGVDIALEHDTHAANCHLLCRDIRDKNLSDELNRYADNGKFDMVVCWELAEHIPSEASETLVDLLARHTGKYLLFTGAPPGQGGDGHINCQPPEYWNDLLTARGLKYQPETTREIRQTWEVAAGPCSWYPNNLQVFERIA